MTKSSGHKNNWVHGILVICVFACTGTTASWLSGLILDEILGLEKHTLVWWILWTIVVTPIYPFLLLGYAFILGKFSYFKDRQLKLLHFITSLFKKLK